MIGRTVAHYRITAQLGERGLGGLCEVCHAKLRRELLSRFRRRRSWRGRITKGSTLAAMLSLLCLSKPIAI